MDAESTILKNDERRTHIRNVSDSEMDQVRSEMIESENKIVEDVNRLIEMLTPRRIADYMIAVARRELAVRLRTLDLDKFSEAKNKIQDGIKDHPVFAASLALGLVSGFVAYGIARNPQSSHIKEEIMGEGAEPIESTSGESLESSGSAVPLEVSPGTEEMAIECKGPGCEPETGI